MKLVRLIKICLNETSSKVDVGKHLSDKLPFQNGLKQGYVVLQFFSTNFWALELKDSATL